MKVKATRTQLMADLSALQSHLKNYKGVQLSFAVLKNIKTMEMEKTLIEAAQSNASQLSPKIGKYEEERVKLCKKHASRDEEGNPIHIQGRYRIGDASLFDAELKKLQKKHAPAVKEMEEKSEEFKKFMDEEVTMEMAEVPLDLLEDDMTAEHIQPLMPFIKE